MATLAIGDIDSPLESSREASDTTQAVLKVKPIASFGLITDIHYADHDDKWNYAGTFLRRYRNSSKLVQQASEYWCNETFPIAFVLQLGDLIDGFCQIDQTSSRDLQTILEQFQDIANICPIYHIWGNHEFYNFTREELLNGPLCSFETKGIAPGHYGTVQVCSNLRVIAIDTYELSVLGIETENEMYSQALDVLKKNNPNDNLNDPTGLIGFEQRFIRLNGGVPSRQLDWLRKQLQAAKDRSEKVIVVGKHLVSLSGTFSNRERIQHCSLFEGHIPIHPNADDELALLWNYDEVLNVLWAFEGVVLAYIAGHAHEGGYFVDQKKIHHLTMHAVVECESDLNAFATVHAYQDCLVIRGSGRIATYRIDYEI